LHSLREHSRWTTSGQLLASLKKAGVITRDASKLELNRALQALVGKGVVHRRRDDDASAVSEFRNAFVERTAFDDLRELHEKRLVVDLTTDTRVVSHPLAKGADRYSATVTLHAPSPTHSQASSAAAPTPSVKFQVVSHLKASPEEAEIDASYRMFHELKTATHVTQSVRRAAYEAYHTAYRRSYTLARLELYHGLPEDGPLEAWHLEFKGGATTNEPAWDMKHAREVARGHCTFFVYALNTWLMEQRQGREPVEDIKLVLGVHDTGIAHGICVKCSTVDELHATMASERENLLQLTAQRLASNTGLSNVPWRQSLSVNVQNLWPEQGRDVTADYFVVALILDPRELGLHKRLPPDTFLSWKEAAAKYRDGGFRPRGEHGGSTEEGRQDSDRLRVHRGNRPVDRLVCVTTSAFSRLDTDPAAWKGKGTSRASRPREGASGRLPGCNTCTWWMRPM
jgi:Fe2+ or Zn2+ uptake regulation protein